MTNNKHYSYDDQEFGIVTKSEKEILDEFWENWSKKIIQKYGNLDNFSKKECIEDWCVLHYAWESD